MDSSKTESVLIGNGLNIQIGGDDYLNKWIIVRLLARAKAGEYDELFMDNKGEPIVTGKDIVMLFNGMVTIANKARKNEYDQVVIESNKTDIIQALKDFKSRYTYKITSVEQIGMEDWFLILLLFLIEQSDILDQYESAKQGFERMILDSIYCGGEIQKLHSKMGKTARTYFKNFENIFTVNYDNNLEKITNAPVFHLHGDFFSKSISENPDNAYGYLRKQNGQNIEFSPRFEHCNCNAILDFSGKRKYELATNMTKAYMEFEDIKKMSKDDKNNYFSLLTQLPEEQREIIEIGIEKDLFLGHNYHFQDFEQLTGTLTIIGLAPQNDDHIFKCINKSNIENVIFYNYFGDKSDSEIAKEIKSISLGIDKPYTIKNIKEVWEKTNLHKPKNSTIYIEVLRNKKGSDFMMDFTNTIYGKNNVLIDDIVRQLKSIPKATEEIIYKMMHTEISKTRYHSTPQSEQELMQNFIDFGETLKVSSISPQALYFLYIIKQQPNKKNRTKAKKKKRKR
ncbi:hypothetical protein K144316041_18250 [Clostridium tetani]|uniref:Uncharacterized protein n=1 Tax=Clostridium tetani TaxID=1513 RepID=A0A4Q0VDE3_CLOTA|nr:hypothetical protein [Clostridium tetani]RXI49996.1 hypothetical protein DP130_03185 [Clostridium tetani]BDR67715.1 hypothetical protein K144312032_19430 [Clostridium tetani]BDR73117.1 hypothetical protein K144316041_18250 [Clostridium tetani]